MCLTFPHVIVCVCPSLIAGCISTVRLRWMSVAAAAEWLISWLNLEPRFRVKAASHASVSHYQRCCESQRLKRAYEFDVFSPSLSSHFSQFGTTPTSLLKANLARSTWRGHTLQEHEDDGERRLKRIKCNSVLMGKS